MPLRITTHLIVIIMALVTTVAWAFEYCPLGPPGGSFKSVEYVSDGMLLAGGFNGHLYLSTDHGNLWRDITPEHLTRGMVVEQITYHAQTDVIYLIARDMKRGLLIRSTRRDFADGLARPDVLLPEQPIRSLALSATNPPRIFVGTDERLHYSLNGGRSWKAAPTQMKNPQMESLAIDPENPDTLYAGSWQRPYKTQNFGRTWQPIHTGMAPDSDVFSLFFDGNNHLWAGTCGHAYRSTNRGQRWVKKRLGLRGKRIHCLAQVQSDGNGDVLSGTDKGLHLFRSEADGWLPIIPDVVVQDITQDESGTFYIATEGMGVIRYRLNPPETQMLNNGLNASSPRAISGSQETTIWAGLMYQDSQSGLWRLRDGKWTKVPLDVVSGNIRAVIASKQYLFVGASDGLIRLDLDVYGFETGSYKRFLEGKTIKSIYLEADGVTVLAGAFDGLYQVNTETGHEAAYPGLTGININCIWKCETSNLLLAGSEGALHRLESGKSAWEPVILPTSVAQISRIIGTRDSAQIYLATSKGVMASYDQGKRFTRSTGNLPEGPCLDVCLVPNGDQKQKDREGQVIKTQVAILMGDHSVHSRYLRDFSWGQVIKFPFDAWSLYAPDAGDYLLVGTPSNGIVKVSKE